MVPVGDLDGLVLGLVRDHQEDRPKISSWAIVMSG